MFGYFPFSVYSYSIHDRRRVLYERFLANKAENYKAPFVDPNERLNAGNNCQWAVKPLKMGSKTKWMRVNLI